ncbi:MAG: hypothetical protein SWH61_14805 [Thermodesulfobacteriota bacterium]|nr:hypothetical protein [Thermodesulfobacteriota bacterium]
MAATIWILSANAAAAEDAEKPPAVKNEKITPLSVVKFSAGMVSAFMVHEAAHELVANATGNSLSWDPGTLNQPIQFREDADSSTDAMYINAAGLTAQLVGTEIILDVDKINKDDAFVRGMVAWNILNPISYALDYWFINRTNKKKTNGYEGDLQGIEYHKGEDTANVFAASIVAVSLVHGYRFIKTQDWAPDWIKPKDNGHTSTVTVQPRRQGVELTYHTTF